MDQRSALPSINGKVDVQDIRPTSSAAVAGRRALGMIPKSAGAVSAVRRTRHSEVAMTSSWQPHENQAQRPSSTNVASRGASVERMAVRVFASEHDFHRQQQNGFKEPENDSREEVQQLRNENATFRHENDLLRSKLVEKMRGQSKVIAGGQFRAASPPTVAKVAVVPSSSCTKCSTARMRSIKAHQETEQAQTAIAELQNYVDKIEAAQQRLWEERSVFVNEIAQLRDRLAEKVEECILIKAECTKVDKQVSVQQPKNVFTEYTQQPANKEVVDNAVQCSLQENCDEEIKADIASLKTEIHLLMQRLGERDQELKRVSGELEGAQKLTKLEKEKREQETRLWNEGSSEQKQRILELEQTEKKLRVYVQDLQCAHQKDVQIIEKANQQLHESIKTKEAEIQALSQHKLENSAREQKQQMVVKELKVRNEQKVADVDRLHAVVAVEKSANVAMKSQIRDLVEQIKTLTKENAELAASSLLLQQQSVDRARIESDKLLSEGQVEQRRLAEALNTAEKDNQLFKARISEVEAELTENDELMQRQKRSHARAMERLLETSLRLCVVAPTVNVQLNTNRESLVNNTSTSTTKVTKDKDSNEFTSVMCRSTPHQDRIKQVIENDVLPLFSSVFLQGDDNASPQADIPMTLWLQDLLHDMQARIATQLDSIYSTASVKISE